MKSTLKCIPTNWKTTKFTMEVQNNFKESSIQNLKKMKTKLEYKKYIESKINGELTTSQKQNIIVLLEKAGKDKTFIKNWRPISLINFDTILLSKLYAERLKRKAVLS
jgi:hypothetical protein